MGLWFSQAPGLGGSLRPGGLHLSLKIRGSWQPHKTWGLHGAIAMVLASS